jgi:hypothetical protein
VARALTPRHAPQKQPLGAGALTSARLAAFLQSGRPVEEDDMENRARCVGRKGVVAALFIGLLTVFAP